MRYRLQEYSQMQKRREGKPSPMQAIFSKKEKTDGAHKIN